MMCDVLGSNVFKIVMRVCPFTEDMVCASLIVCWLLLAYSRRRYIRPNMDNLADGSYVTEKGPCGSINHNLATCNSFW